MPEGDLRTKFKTQIYLINHFIAEGAVVAVIAWLLNVQLPMQSVPITTDVVGSNLDQGEVHNIMW